MSKRRKISEIFNDMNEINKRKPTDKELDELAEVLNEIDDTGENKVDFPFEKIASKEGNLHGNKSDRIQ